MNALSNVMVVKERVGPTNGYMQTSSSVLTLNQELIFAVQQMNVDLITKKLNDVSDPSSPDYGKHLTKEQVDELTVNHEGHRQVLEFLSLIGAEIVSSNDNYITAKASIEIWNQSLNTKFYEYQNAINGKSVQRCVEYSLPEDLAPQIASVMNTVQFPYDIHSGKEHPSRIGKVLLTKGPQLGH